MIGPGPWRPFIVKAVMATAVLFAGFTHVAARYRLGIDWQVERCLPDTRAVLIDLQSSLPGRHELIAFRGLGLEPFFEDGMPMVKILAGLPGDRVEIAPASTTVNGIEVAAGLHLAADLGHAPEAFSRGFIVPPGAFFVVGLSKTSFDSRYFGPIREEQILGKAWRLG